MFEIDEIKIEHSKKDAVTDNTQPVLSFSLRSDEDGCELSRAVVCVGDIKKEVTGQTGIVLDGLGLEPFTEYTVKLTAFDNMGRSASKEADFSTGRLSVPWTANWITDKVYSFAKNTSPAPFTFRKSFSVKKPLKRAFVTATALGIYELNINGKKVGNEYFAPGFTSYKHSLQYNLYDIGDLLADENTIIAVVGGGWAAGRFTYSSKSRITCDRQAFLMELFLEYRDGSTEKIVTDGTWQVTTQGNYRFGDFYDGETYDATVDLNKIKWSDADIYTPKFKPHLSAQYGCKVTAHEILQPIDSFPAKNGKETVYDFGQNFAGAVHLKMKGKAGQ